MKPNPMFFRSEPHPLLRYGNKFYSVLGPMTVAEFDKLEEMPTELLSQQFREILAALAGACLKKLGAGKLMHYSAEKHQFQKVWVGEAEPKVFWFIVG